VKISLKVEYACRVLAQLARTYGNARLAHIDELAEAEAIPPNYLVQILNELRNGGLINSRRGKQGGYALARDPHEVTLYDVIAIVEPDLLESTISQKGQSGAKVSAVWAKLNDRFCEETRTYTLAKLLPKDVGDMYYI